jgi:AraC family ethanolamine operon transcriptional activator
MLTPSPSAIAKLQGLSAAAGQLAQYASEIIAYPEAAHGLEQALIEAMLGCLGSSKDHGKSLARAQHAIVMHRFRRAVEQHPGEPLYILQICKAIGVSERALRMCCQEYLGTSPKRYLLLRRMHQARRALREAASDTTTVATIATQFGFWHLGRFAINYQALFGESPSGTLRR